MLQRVKEVQESDLRMVGALARNIQRVIAVTQADIDAAAAQGKAWVVKPVVKVSDPLDNLRGGTQLVIKQNSILPGQNVMRVMYIGGQAVVVGPGTSPLSLPDAMADDILSLIAFGGTEQRNLPDDYVQRQYIYMMDSSYLAVENQSITSDYKIEFDFATVNFSSGLANYFGARASGVAAGGGFRLTKLSNNGVAMYGFDTTDAYESAGNVLATNTRYKYVYDNGTCTISSGGTDVLTHTYTVNDTSTITAFGINAYTSNGTTYATSGVGIYCYGLKIWNGQGELVMNLVPVVQRGTVPVVGFYDTVSETFKTATAGTFAAGPELVPTPDAPMDIICNNGVLKVNKNLITGSLTQGIYSNGVLDTTVTTWVAYDTFIPVESGKTYTLKATPSVTGKTIEQNVMKYKDGVYVGYTSLANVPYTFTPDDTYNQVKLQFAYQPRENITPSNITNVQLYQNGSIYADGTTETINVHTKNLFNEQWNRNTGVSTQTATWGQVVSAQGWSTSGLVPVKAGQQYTVSYNTTVAIYVFYYESDGTMQQSYDYATSNTKKTFTVPNGATHIRLQVNKNTEEAIAALETQLETGATDTAYVPYFNGGTATAEMLLSVGNYTDEQEVISGAVTRNVGIKVMTGNETFQAGTNGWISEDTITNNLNAIYIPICTHFAGTDTTPIANSNTVRVYYTSQNVPRVYFGVDKTIPEFSSTTAFQQWLADQYAAGTPVIIVYPLATATTESVTGQPMATTEDDNIAEITQASLNNLELQVEYMGE